MNNQRCKDCKCASSMTKTQALGYIILGLVFSGPVIVVYYSVGQWIAKHG